MKAVFNALPFSIVLVMPNKNYTLILRCQVLESVDMLYVIDCKDKPEALLIRLDTRVAHLAYLEKYSEQLVMAGPFLCPQGNMIGSMLIMAFETPEEVAAFCANDPYALAGLFESVAIRPWKITLPA
jgi:uncharacterized protein YciI